MDSSDIKYYKYCKNKNLITDSCGEWVTRLDYERLLWEFNDCKKEWTLENAMLQMCRVIDNLKLDANNTFVMQVLINSMLLSLQSIKEKAFKDKQINTIDKGDTIPKV